MSNLATKKKQKMLKMAFFALACAIFAALIALNATSSKAERTKTRESRRADVPLSLDSASDLSHAHLSSQIEEVRKENEILKKQLANKALEIEEQLEFDSEAQKKAYLNLHAMLEKTQKQIGHVETRIAENQKPESSEMVVEAAPVFLDEPILFVPEQQHVEEIVDEEVGSWQLNCLTPYGESLCSFQEEAGEISVNNGAIAGTTVRAILETGVVASFAPDSRNDPSFIKLRIMDDARLPKGLRSKLKDGYLLGSAFADLSIERLRCRIEKLVVFREDGTTQETTVVGIASDEKGYPGVSGTIIDRSPEIIKNAGFAGVIEGFSNYLATQVHVQQFSSSGCCYPSDATGFLAQGGLAGGSRAMERIGDHFAYMLESYHPYLQVQSGRMVDVTFLETSVFGDTGIYVECAEIREQTRGKSFAKLEEIGSKKKFPLETVADQGFSASQKDVREVIGSFL